MRWGWWLWLWREWGGCLLGRVVDGWVLKSEAYDRFVLGFLGCMSVDGAALMGFACVCMQR